MQRRKTDQRSRRTRERLGSALMELIQEKHIKKVTIQDVLNRAEVGRSTFYTHFHDKDDLLLSVLERFLETMSTMLSSCNEQSHRILPVAEFFAHIENQSKAYRALVDSGRVNDFLDLAQGYFARSIEQRLKQFKRSAKLPDRELRARSAALAGNVLSLLRWWLDSNSKESPQRMDELFHVMVWRGLQ